MQSSSPILAKLRNMSPQHIHQLSPEEMKNLLNDLHLQARQQTPSSNTRHCPKHKMIEKVLTKRELKDHLKHNLKNILRKTQLNRHSQNQSGTMKEGGAELGGKSKFKQPSTSQHHKPTNNFQSFIKTALKQTSSDELTCSICLQILVHPALTPCGHVFCLSCLDETTLLNTVCPICRELIKGSEPIACPLLDKLIRTKMEVSPCLDEAERYWERTKQFESWMTLRMLDYDSVVEGQMLDVRDTESIWCQGKVLEVYRSSDKKDKSKVTAVMVHYNRWHKIYNEIIEVPSHRLAPLSCYSGRVEIPRYNLAEEMNNVRGSVISGPPRVEMPSPFNFIQIFDSESESRREEEEDQENEEEEEEEDEHQLLSNLDPSNSQFLEEEEEEQEEESDSAGNNDSPLGLFSLRNIIDGFRSRLLANRIPRLEERIVRRPSIQSEDVEQIVSSISQFIGGSAPVARQSDFSIYDQLINEQMEANESQPEMIEQ